MHCGARGGACYIRVKQTFSHNCHEWETEIELATSGGHDTGESTTYIFIIFIKVALAEDC